MRPLPTVDTGSAPALAAAVARGYRSLLIRGLLAQENPDGAALLVPLSLVGVKPGLMATWVTDDLTMDPEAERFELFATQDGGFVAVTTRPGGIHVVNPVEGRDGLEFFADMARLQQGAQGDDRATSFCLLVRGPDEELAGGYVVRASGVVRLARGASGGLEPAGEEQVEPTTPAWRARINGLLSGPTTTHEPI